MFFIYKIMPGDPVTMMLGDAKANMKPDAYQRLYEQTRESLGLNSPLYVQYIRWIGNMLTTATSATPPSIRPTLST